MRISKNYKAIDFPPLNSEQRAELDALKSMPDEAIDYSDIHKHTKKDFERGQFYYAASLKMPKTDIHIKIDIEKNMK